MTCTTGIAIVLKCIKFKKYITDNKLNNIKFTVGIGRLKNIYIPTYITQL